MEKRIEWIDSLKGVLIILVIWGHLNIPILAETIIYSFHMPLFFFISGYLFRNKDIPIKDYFVSKFKSLIIPYIIYAAISFPFGIFLNMINGREINIINDVLNFFYFRGSVGWNSPLWFLVVLFLVEVIYFVICKSKFNRFLTILLFFILFFLTSNRGQNYPLGLNIALAGLTFYYFGNITREKGYIEFLLSTKTKCSFSIIIFLMLNIIFGVVMNPRISMYANRLGNFGFFYLAAISGILLIIIVLSKAPSIKLLTFFGQNTLIILATQYFFKHLYKICDNVFFNSRFTGEDSYFISILLVIITLVAYVPLILITNKFFPLLNGKNIKS